MPKDWEPPADLELPEEGDLEEIVNDELDVMLAERALEAMLSDDEDTVAANPSAETDDDEDAGDSDTGDDDSAGEAADEFANDEDE